MELVAAHTDRFVVQIQFHRHLGILSTGHVISLRLASTRAVTADIDTVFVGVRQ